MGDLTDLGGTNEMPLAIASIARWQTLEDELEADVEFRRGGQLLVTEDPALIPELERRVAEHRALGVDIRLVQGDEFKELAPGFAPSITAGMSTVNDGQASAPLTTRAFGAAAERHGACIRTGVTVTGIQQQGGRVTGVETSGGPIACDWLVLAAGIWATWRAWRGWMTRGVWTDKDMTAGKVFAGAIDLQFAIGVILYAVSPLIRQGFSDFGEAMRTQGIRYFLV